MDHQNELGIQRLAIEQVQAGAEYIDVNAGAFISDEVELLKWLVGLVQSVTDKPLCIDTTNSKALEESLKICKQKALINSISLEGNRFDDVSKLAVKYGASVIGLCQAADKIPNHAEERIEAGQILVERLLKVGMTPENIYLDPLVTAISVDEKAGMVTFQTVTGIKKKMPNINIVCGLSNIGFGLPKRKLINRTFLAMLVAAGLDGAIVDPLDKLIMTEILLAELTAGKDPLCRRYLKAYKAGLIG